MGPWARSDLPIRVQRSVMEFELSTNEPTHCHLLIYYSRRCCAPLGATAISGTFPEAPIMALSPYRNLNEKFTRV